MCAQHEEKLEQVLLEWKEGAPFVNALKAFRGFILRSAQALRERFAICHPLTRQSSQTVAAITIASELGSMRRFRHPRQLMGYLGLVTGENSTGDRRRQGSITKCGNSHVRWILVESAQHYRLDPKVSPQLSKRQEGQSKEVKEISWRAQNYPSLRSRSALCSLLLRMLEPMSATASGQWLNYRYKRLSARKLNRNKVIVAMARELCAFIWELFTTLPQPELQAPPEAIAITAVGDDPAAQLV